MSSAQKEFVVSPSQVLAAREYIKRERNPRKITKIIRELAAMDLDEVDRRWQAEPINEEKIHLAKLLVDLHGEENVSPEVARIARAKPEA